MILQPLLSDIGICALVPEIWGDIWQPRHYILTRLARYFHVTWINPASEWRYILSNSNVQKLNHADWEVPPGFIVYEPNWLPRLYHPEWLSEYVFNLRLRRAHRILTDKGCRKIILYIWRPEFAPALNSIPFDLSCYHIDDEYSFSEGPVELTPAERALITKVDQVFIHSPGLMEKKGEINSQTLYVPNGVDFPAYASRAAEPKDLAVIPGPRIGYTGYIKKQIDWDLILNLVERHTKWSFVFVGPRSPHPEIAGVLQRLSSYSNVYFLGPKSVHDLPAYTQYFDACIMPYRVDAYTNSIYPLKLHEYLASGRPVVSTPIRSLRDFEGTIALAGSFSEWSNALTRALEPGGVCPEAVNARRAIARQYDWDRLVGGIARTLCERMGAEYKQRFELMSDYSGEGVKDLAPAP